MAATFASFSYSAQRSVKWAAMAFLGGVKERSISATWAKEATAAASPVI
jgi:hypothetical protein